MIDGIFQLGKAVRLNSESMPADEITIKSNKIYKICKLNFDINKETISIDLSEEFSKGKEDNYKVVSLKLSGRQNQFFVTFKDIKRLIIETDKKGNKKRYACWISLKDELNNLDWDKDKDKKNFYEKIIKIYDIFYENDSFDFSRFGNNKINDLLQLKKHLKENLGKNEEIIFYSILVNDEKLCDDKVYSELLYTKIVESKKKQGNIVCSLCGNIVNEYFDDFARMPIKFFINDKIGFSQKLSNKWDGSFQLCENCYISLLYGQKFIEQNSMFSLNKISYMIIPEFLNTPTIGINKFKEWFNYIKNYYNPFKFFDDNSEVRRRLLQYKEYDMVSYFWLNYVFFEQNNQQFKIYSVIKDIPNSRIDKIRDKFDKYKTKIFNNFPLLNEIKLKSLADIYWIIPLRYSSKDNKILELPKILNIFSDILEERTLDRSLLVKEFWYGIKAKYFNNISYHNVRKSENSDFELVQYLLQTHQLLIFLNILEGGNKMDVNINKLPDNIKNYLNELNFNKKQTSLFLLGTLIGDIGSRQIKYGNKPVLNKINFQGMGIDRIMILFNEIYEKLIQEKMLNTEKETIYSIAHGIFDREKNNWDLKPHENVYYCLAGYSYKTYVNIKLKTIEQESKKYDTN